MFYNQLQYLYFSQSIGMIDIGGVFGIAILLLAIIFAGLAFYFYKNSKKHLSSLNASLLREEQFEKMTEVTTDAIFLTNYEMKIIYVNQAASQLFGYADGELLSKPIAVLFDDNSDNNFLATANSLIEISGISKAGKTFPLEISLSVLQLHDKWHSVGIMRDITIRKEADEDQRKLAVQIQSNKNLKSMAVLAGGIAHKFNNKLMVIQNSAELSMMDLPDESVMREDLQTIIDAVKESATLCELMLTYSGQGRCENNLLNINQLIKEMTPEIKRMLPKDVGCNFNLNATVPYCTGDHDQLSRVITNLLINSIESFTGNEGVVTISTQVQDIADSKWNNSGGELVSKEVLSIKITDNGCGINKEDLPKIFDPFFTTKFTGRGLGLATSQGIINNHAGQIYCESSSAGTIMTILLALSKPAKSAVYDNISSNSVIEIRRPLVLLIDDNNEVLRIASVLLKHLGCDILLASSGEQAIQLFSERHQDINLVFIDLILPDINGDIVYEKILEIEPDIKCILASGYPFSEVGTRFQLSSNSDFIQKPYSMQVLKQALTKLESGVEKHGKA